MVAEDFLQDQQVRQWLDGVEPVWTLLTFDSLRALRREPSARQNAIRIANDLSADEIADSAFTRNTFILLRQAIERGGLPLTATGNLSRAVVAEMRGHRMAALRPSRCVSAEQGDQRTRLSALACRPYPRAGSYSGPRAAWQVGSDALGEIDAER